MPRDRVLALLPIPGKPLQARYHGPCTVDRKNNDVNYIVNTPGRRKQKQLCHVNMLKNTSIGIILQLHQLVLLAQSLRNKVKWKKR